MQSWTQSFLCILFMERKKKKEKNKSSNKKKERHFLIFNGEE